MDLTIHVIRDNGTGVPPIDLTVDAGGIDIGGDSNGAPSATHTATVTDNTSVDISVIQSGYHTYTMTIDNVYEEDKTIYILLVDEITDINDPDYNKPNALHFYFVDPCSFNVDFYSATSYGGEITWYINNIYHSAGNKGVSQFCLPGNYQIKQRVQTYYYTVGACPQQLPLWDRQWANTDEPTYVLPGFTTGVGETGNTVAGTVADISTYLDLDTEVNVTVEEYRPDFTLEISSPVNQLDDACCYTREEEVTIVPTITLNRDGADPALHTLVYSVIDPEGLDVTLTTSTFPLDVTPISISFSLEKLGVYTVTATLTDQHCDISYTRTIEIETCNFIVIEYVDCNTFTINNRSSSTDIEIDIDNIDGTSVIQSISIPSSSSYTVSFTNVSLYTVTATYTKSGDTEPTIEIYVLNNYCGIEECISTYILDILCEDTRRCAPCPDEVELNQMLLLNYTYFMKLNNEYGWNNFYSGLSKTKLDELAEIKQVMDRLLEFCARRSCSTSSFSKGYSTEGPYDYAGKGNNSINCTCSPIKQGSYYNITNPGYCSSCGGAQ